MSLIGVLRTLHAWTGAVLSLLLVVIGLSGALLVFRDDALRVTIPAAREPAALSAPALGGALEAIERRHPGEARILLAAPDGFGLHRLYRTSGAGYVSQSGEALPPAAGRWSDALADAHRRLFAGKTGHLVVGLAGVGAVLLVLSGLVVWAPAWRSFGLRVWPRSAQRRDLVAAHRNLGALLALPLLLFCATGVAMSFEAMSGKLLAKALPQAPPPPPPTPPAGVGDIDWPRALAAVHARFPEGVVRMIEWPGEAGAPAVVRLSQPGDWISTQFAIVRIDPATSTILAAADGESVPQGAVLQAALAPLHAAGVGGRLYDVLAFLSGLALAGLGGLGLWSFLIKPRRRKAVS